MCGPKVRRVFPAAQAPTTPCGCPTSRRRRGGPTLTSVRARFRARARAGSAPARAIPPVPDRSLTSAVPVARGCRAHP